LKRGGTTQVFRARASQWWATQVQPWWRRGFLLAVLPFVFITPPGYSQNAANAFPVWEYRVLGNSTLDVKSIERAVMPFLGPNKTIKDVEQARVALENVYHTAGYGTVFVDIPEQSVADGIVRLRVTEGKLHSSVVTGARYYSERAIKAAVPESTEGKVPNLTVLQAQIAAVNGQTPDRTVVPVLKAGPLPGTVDLSMRVQDDLPLHGSVEINNQYTADTRPTRVLAALSYGDLFGRQDDLSVQYEGTPGLAGEVGVVAGNYSTHVGDSGDQLAFYVLHSSSDIAALGALAVLGEGTVYGARWVMPVTRQSSLLQSVTLGIDYKDFGQSVNVDPTTSLNTPIHYVNLTAAYSESRNTVHSQLQWSVTTNFGPRDAPNNDALFANKRYLATGNYFYLRGDASLTLFNASKWQVILAIDGQLAAEPLISNEEFSIGGASSVRGYLETESLGDDGIRGSLQVQSPPWRWGHGNALMPFVFFDVAHAQTLDALASDVPSTTLQSAGGGLNVTALGCLSGNLTWADPLQTAGRTVAHDSRLLFSARCSW
jgi:hemolysin activation/secretion protein